MNIPDVENCSSFSSEYESVSEKDYEGGDNNDSDGEPIKTEDMRKLEEQGHDKIMKINKNIDKKISDLKEE